MSTAASPAGSGRIHRPCGPLYCRFGVSKVVLPGSSSSRPVKVIQPSVPWSYQSPNGRFLKYLPAVLPLGSENQWKHRLLDFEALTAYKIDYSAVDGKPGSAVYVFEKIGRGERI